MFTIKKTTFLIAFNIICLLGLAQSNIRLNNFWENTNYINPAYINEDYLGELSVASRKQWLSLPGSPTTFYGSGSAFIEKWHTQFGLKVTQDKIGFTSTSDVDLSYAYSLKMNKEWRMHLGFAVSYQMLSYDLTEMHLPITNVDNVATAGLLSENNFNSDLGIELTDKSWRFGVSGQNVFSLLSKINNQYTNTNFLYAMYRQNTDQLINLGFGVCGIQYGNLYQMEMNMTSYFNLSKANDQFHLGMFYRTRNEMGAIFGFDLRNNIGVSYSYDFNLGGLSKTSTGTHELIISYKLNKIVKCHNCMY